MPAGLVMSSHRASLRQSCAWVDFLCHVWVAAGHDWRLCSEKRLAKLLEQGSSIHTHQQVTNKEDQCSETWQQIKPATEVW